MSEPLSNDVSTESLCTVIETSSNEYLSNKFKDPIKSTSLESLDTNRISPQNNLKQNGCHVLRGSLDESCDTDTTEKSLNNATTEEEGECEKKPKSKLKKSVSFDPNDEKIRKFITGEPIVDQQNPFKSNGYLANGTIAGAGSAKRKDKKTPPPVPAKRSTLSVRKTVTQQLREREREKEKERERLKNEANNRKSNGSIIKSPSDEFVSTEDVLKQSKYVKTYIKNPDPYFVYDPTVLARLKFEELRELALKKPPKRIVPQQQQPPQPQPRERLKDLKNRQNENKPTKPSTLTFKKCSKPNYPELSDLKIKTGTDLEDSLYNPLEVTKNAKKFDERVKKLHISSDDDLDEIEEPLTKSESSDDNNMNAGNRQSDDKMPPNEENGSVSREPSPPPPGTFTNTIKSKEFQEYLEKKGLTLIPKKIPNGAQPLYGNKPQQSTPLKQISFKAEPERIQFSSNGTDSVDTGGNNRKPSVFQRLLANSIFASRRKTTPKEPVPIIKPLYEASNENGSLKPIKRVVLERQSFHGRPKAGNLLSPAEALELKQQLERSRKSYASGDDVPLSISSSLTNAENPDLNDSQNFANIKPAGTPGLRRKELQAKTIAKPPRRTLSRDRITKYEPPKMVLSERPTNVNNNLYTLAREQPAKNDANFRRTLDRQSMIPKRTTQQADKQQVFGRSSSMDRNEILKRNINRNQQQRSNSVTGEALLAPITTKSRENVQETTFPVNDGPPITSTPIRQSHTVNGLSTKTISPISSIPKKASQLGVYVDQQEWEKLRAIKEQTDKELYHRVMQQQQKLQQQQQQQQQQQKSQQEEQKTPTSPPHASQQQQQSSNSEQKLENIYEHLPGGSQVRLAPGESSTFTRGSPQRNTFSGIIRSNNRQVKIIDGKPVVAPETMQSSSKLINGPVPRSQSVLDNVTRRGGYESETPETPVVLRRKAEGDNSQQQQQQPTRRIGGLLTREEILQKIKEFCRKSINKTPTNQAPVPLQAIYEKQPTGTDLSPVSYVSVETHQRPASRMYAAPQVPQRMHSLPAAATATGHFVPIAQEIVTDPNTNSPIYAHVVKRGSLQSNQSELYEIPQRTLVAAPPPTQYFIRREAAPTELKPVYIRQGTLQRPESAFSPAPTQYILVDGEKLQPAQLIAAYPQTELYAQPQYIRPHQLQSMPGASYGYITVREPLIHQGQPQHPQMIRPRLHDGRSTPLILDRSSQQVSQIYWTPQHQRLQQQAGLLTDQISPRYALKQSYVMPGPQQQQLLQNRATPLILQHPQLSPHIQNIPAQRQYSPSPLIREPTPTQTMHQIQQTKPQQPQIQELTLANARQSPAFDWESGSEAGEVQRIMEKQQQHDQKTDLNYLHLDLPKAHQLQITQNG
ncbi:formin-J [Stomoxys calcitrans]|uniref:formin-J n=1 Tax=Stomoxys calcitrans TaxID=35570 RepID=UPI0027E30842|nr:formin-J [Stomoxys calcitrans]XP_059222803.1 formin-J [Stomoxys calcitrans]XP_059222804.1 formin-J [Stomoxys calcitrans]XP_059222805.1 formin-J [Stomoxys calcitrans]XP_059222806.1 formin-J [Stomoxys calcitrans]XP_059222807.1 formin-J [Stomoxys calcitrans]XP_059222809.1 formin-J [Stomoxys calcitrans]XP_059222810.1 formin-J [Stomoxys calcitrans]XP_059222811.1 formin-J [Stomoxys calcitrans]XP_059222812.1 formin-J [Stomoxys calcitrans]XP_059222813.1 formin-J [Stomoxys calcitrans]XP_059222